METLLRMEGVEVVEDRVVEFPTRFWDPGRELAL